MQKTDGFMIGNGRCYLVEGSSYELDRCGKTSDLYETPIPFHSIVCLNGPVYGFNHFAYGFTVTLEYTENGSQRRCGFESGMNQSIRYEADSIINQMGNGDIEILIKDAVRPHEDVIVRSVSVHCRDKIQLENPKLILQYQYDKRNLTYCDFDGSPLPMPESVSAPLRYEDHVLPESDQVTFRIPANKPMYNDESCDYGKQLNYGFMRERFLTVSAVPAAQKVTDTSFEIPLGQNLSAEILFGFGFTRQESVPSPSPAVIALSGERERIPIIESDCVPIPWLFQRIDSLIHANTSETGGVLAQPVMYPMAYNRDIYGSFLFYCAMGNLATAKKVLWFFHICQTTYDLQNAYDIESFGYEPGPDFRPVPSYHKNAEMPSYFILMARDYYRLSSDLEMMEKLYPHLLHNLESQKLTAYFTIGTEGDESYTNFPESSPTFSEEMTDSCFLYTAACEFISEIAEKLGHKEDHDRYAQRAEQCRKAVENRMWLPDKGHYLFSRNGDQVDERPALDLLCHPLFFQYADPHHRHSFRSFLSVLDHLLSPHLQIVPGFNKCAGGDIGYLLYNAASFQHPAADRFFEDYEKFVSSSGAFSEYYSFQNGEYHRQGGNLRPWESGINGYALLNYLFGIKVDLPNRILRLAPHLPSKINRLSIKNYPVGEAVMSLQLSREGEEEILELCGDLTSYSIQFVTGSACSQTALITVNGQPVPPDVFTFEAVSKEYTVPVTMLQNKAVIRIRRE